MNLRSIKTVFFYNYIFCLWFITFLFSSAYQAGGLGQRFPNRFGHGALFSFLTSVVGGVWLGLGMIFTTVAFCPCRKSFRYLFTEED
jgi:hypothetical protein